MSCHSSELAREARDTLLQGSSIPEDEFQRTLHTLKDLFEDTLLEGVPLSNGKITDRMDLSTGRIQLLLDEFGAERNEAGEITGLGLTLEPTPHAYRVGGTTLYTWCAPDALLYPNVFGHTARVSSSDPVTEEEITLTVSPEGIEALTPSTTVVSWAREADASDLRETFCRQGHFFTNRSTAEQWQSDHPDTEILDIQEALEAVRQMDVFT